MTMHYIYQSSKYCHSETVTFEDILQIWPMDNVGGFFPDGLNDNWQNALDTINVHNSISFVW